MELSKFYEHIEIVNDNLVKYFDEEGNISILPFGALLCTCTFLQVDNDRLKVMKFNKEVDKDMEFEQEEITVQVDKSTITKDKKDQFTVVDKKIIINKMWQVKNGAGASQVFNNQEKAIKFVEEKNATYINKVKI